MGAIPDIAICVAIICLPAGIGCVWLGVRMIRGKSLQYIAGNANNVFDKMDDEAGQKAMGGAMGAMLVVIDLLLLAMIPLVFLFG